MQPWLEGLAGSVRAQRDGQGRVNTTQKVHSSFAGAWLYQVGEKQFCWGKKKNHRKGGESVSWCRVRVALPRFGGRPCSGGASVLPEHSPAVRMLEAAANRPLVPAGNPDWGSTPDAPAGPQRG